jgi:sRNA-binding carbon storage regulator CsrA
MDKIRLVKYKQQSNSTRRGWILRVEVYMKIKSRRRGQIASRTKDLISKVYANKIQLREEVYMTIKSRRRGRISSRTKD